MPRPCSAQEGSERRGGAGGSRGAGGALTAAAAGSRGCPSGPEPFLASFLRPFRRGVCALPLSSSALSLPGVLKHFSRPDRSYYMKKRRFFGGFLNQRSPLQGRVFTSKSFSVSFKCWRRSYLRKTPGGFLNVSKGNGLSQFLLLLFFKQNRFCFGTSARGLLSALCRACVRCGGPSRALRGAGCRARGRLTRRRTEEPGPSPAGQPGAGGRAGGPGGSAGSGACEGRVCLRGLET